MVDDERCTRFRHELPSFVDVMNVPESFITQKARYKARAIDYFRRQSNLTKEDWVLHLDEESILDKHAMKACLDFIERGNEDIGMV